MNAANKMKIQSENACPESGFERNAWHHHHTPIGYAMKMKNALKTWTFQVIKNVNAKHCVSALILLTLGTIIYYTHYVDNSPFIG